MVLEDFKEEEIKVPTISRNNSIENKEDFTKRKKRQGFFDKLFNRKKLNKPKRVAVIYLRNNGVAEPIELESKKGFFNIEGHVYHEDKDCIYTITKDRIPLAIIPEWSLIPIGTKRWEDKPMLEKFHECEDHIIRGIRHAELVRMGDKDSSTKLDMKKAILIGVGAIVVIAVLLNYV